MSLMAICLLFATSCKSHGDIFFKGDQKIAYWDILKANQQPAGYGYAFARNGNVDYYSHAQGGLDRRIFDDEDALPANNQWEWNGDTLLVRGLSRLIFPIDPDTYLMINPKIGDVFWLAYSKDQTSQIER